ncbi:MAG: nuclear transport factor 2 family protein [Terriglobales bacterium]
MAPRPKSARNRDPAAQRAEARLRLEEARVHEANRRFYQALESLCLEDMEAVWLSSPAARCVHPGWPPLEGWSDIRESWSRIFAHTHQLEVAIDQVRLQIAGPVAWVTCLEEVHSLVEGRMDRAQLCATNVFVLAGGEWRLALHHASHLPDLPEPAGSETIQ